LRLFEDVIFLTAMVTFTQWPD